MFKILVSLFLNACIGCLCGSAFAITVGISAPSARHVTQGQLFYSQTVSRISNGTEEACMVSTGSNWRDNGEVRRAEDVAPILENGGTLQAAFDRSEPISIKSLRSNTPFMAFVVNNAGDTFVRLGAGFKIAQNGAHLSANGNQRDLNAIEHEIELRGDSLKITDKSVAAAMLQEFLSGNVFSFAAQSHKPVSGGTEHVLQYQFQGKNDQAALSNCITDMSNPRRALKVGSHAQFALKPVKNQFIQDRMIARAMACNRDLDPEGAEVMEFDGPLLGFSTPLAYALVRRDSNGQISDIWSGDLWRVSNSGSGLEIAFSNSITRQGPLDEQVEKACTRFGDARPVFFDSKFADGLGITTDFSDALAQAGLFNQGILSPISVITSSSGFAGGSVPILSASTPKPPVSKIVLPPTDPPQPILNEDENANVVPIPAAAWLFIAALAMFGVVGRRGAETPN